MTALSPRLPLRLLPIRQEPFQPDVGQRMPRQLLQYRERARGDMRAHLGGADHVQRVADARDQHFSGIRVVEDVRGDG